MASGMASMVLPTPPSWYPGHMRQFVRNLPALLSRTDVVLELRDSRLPLTSINHTFESVLQKWRHERQKLAEAFQLSAGQPFSSGAPTLRGHSSLVSERIVVMNKRDLVPAWGIEPFKKALASRYPDQHTIFASWNRPRDVKALHETIVNIARQSAHVSTELNVLVVGMPNVGKSTLLNALRNMGIPGPTPKALRTSANPGLTRALSTRLKLSQDPLVYSFDSPGVMLPFLGKGDLGAERGIKLALIAGIRAGLYADETLAEYLLYRLNLLDPKNPAYLSLLPAGTPPITDTIEFLEALAERLSMLKRGGARDVERSAAWFIRWWREEGCALSASAPLLSEFTDLSRDTIGLATSAESEKIVTQSEGGAKGDVISEDGEAPRNRLLDTSNTSAASSPLQRQSGGWGFDFQWQLTPAELDAIRHPSLTPSPSIETPAQPSPENQDQAEIKARMETLIGQKMGAVIDDYLARSASETQEGLDVSVTQIRKAEKAAQKAKREKRVREMLARRRAGK